MLVHVHREARDHERLNDEIVRGHVDRRNASGLPLSSEVVSREFGSSMIHTSPGLMTMGRSHVMAIAVLETIFRGGVQPGSSGSFEPVQRRTDLSVACRGNGCCL
jgi:hypothetical protein